MWLLGYSRQLPEALQAIFLVRRMVRQAGWEWAHAGQEVGSSGGSRATRFSIWPVANGDSRQMRYP